MVDRSMQTYPQSPRKLRGQRKKLTYPASWKETFNRDLGTEAMSQVAARQYGGSLCNYSLDLGLIYHREGICRTIEVHPSEKVKNAT